MTRLVLKLFPLEEAGATIVGDNELVVPDKVTWCMMQPTPIRYQCHKPQREVAWDKQDKWQAVLGSSTTCTRYVTSISPAYSRFVCSPASPFAGPKLRRLAFIWVFSLAFASERRQAWDAAATASTAGTTANAST